MIKHIVFFRLKDSAGGRTAAENARLIQEKLQALAGVIPGLLRIEVGIDFSRSETSSDIALYSELENRAALGTYQAHPAHQAILPLIVEARSERRVVDYESP